MQCESTIYFGNSLSIYSLFSEFNWNSLSISRINFDLLIFLWIHYYPRELNFNSLSFSQIQYKFNNFLTDSLFFLGIQIDFTIVFTYSLWIPFLLRELTFFFANSLLIHYYFHELNFRSSRIHFRFTMWFAKPLLSFSPSHFIEVNSLWFLCLLDEFSIN